jgi:hypothetical protein
VSHPKPDAVFAICQIETGKALEWNRKTIVSRIEALIDTGHLERVHSGTGKGNPHLYRLSLKKTTWGALSIRLIYERYMFYYIVCISRTLKGVRLDK